MYGENTIINDRKFMQKFLKTYSFQFRHYLIVADLNKLLNKNYVKGLNYQKLSSFWVQKTDRVTQTSALSFLV